jgi:hypothetical protein
VTHYLGETVSLTSEHVKRERHFSQLIAIALLMMNRVLLVAFASIVMLCDGGIPIALCIS